jgi:hypothetical protein
VNAEYNNSILSFFPDAIASSGIKPVAMEISR